MTETSAAASVLSADETPAAVPGVATEAPSPETPIADKADSPVRRKRTSVRALRAELAAANTTVDALRQDNLGSRQRNRELRDRIYELEDSNLSLTEQNGAQAKSLTGARTALELVLCIIAMDKTPTQMVEFLPKEAKAFGVDFQGLGNEVEDALGKAYARTPKRAIEATVAAAQEKFTERIGALLSSVRGGPGRSRPGVSAISGSGIGSLMAVLAGLGGPAPTDVGDPGDLLSAILGGEEAPDCGNPDCQGHPQQRSQR